MTQYVKSDVPNMVIDQSSGAALNNDIGAYHAIKKAREEKKRAANLEQEVASLKQMVLALAEEVARLKGE